MSIVYQGTSVYIQLVLLKGKFWALQYRCCTVDGFSKEKKTYDNAYVMPILSMDVNDSASLCKIMQKIVILSIF
jgi:hypothetical protein